VGEGSRARPSAARLKAQRRVSYLDGASSLGVGSVGISPAWVAGASAVVSGLSFSTALCSVRNSVLSGSGASSTLLGASEVILRRYEHEAAGLVLQLRLF